MTQLRAVGFSRPSDDGGEWGGGGGIQCTQHLFNPSDSPTQKQSTFRTAVEANREMSFLEATDWAA